MSALPAPLSNTPAATLPVALPAALPTTLPPPSWVGQTVELMRARMVREFVTKAKIFVSRA
jgi:hypothetical protein